MIRQLTTILPTITLATLLAITAHAQTVAADATEHQVTRIYDIRDLLMIPDDTQIPAAITAVTTEGKQAPTKQATVKQTPAKQTSSIFDETSSLPSQRTAQDITRDIIDVILTTVAHDTWIREGGKIGSIREHDGQLIITQTQKNHTAVHNLIQQLRETRSLTIPIEIQVWLVTEDALKRITKSAKESLPPPAPGSVTMDEPTINGMILAVHTSFHQALQKETSATLIAEKKITVHNGQTLHLPITSKITYVSGYTAVDEPGKATEYVENYSTVHPGLIVRVEQTVSADGRYVVAKAGFITRKLTGMKASLAPNTPPEKKLMIETPELLTEPPVARVDDLNNGFVALPKIRFTAIDTMVSIPENATLILTGPTVTQQSLRGSIENAHDKDQPKYRVLLTYTPKIVKGF